MQLLGLAPVVVAAAPYLDKIVPKRTAYRTYILGKNALIGEYNEYANFSSFAIPQSIDESVAKAAEELGHQAGLTMNKMVACTF